MLSAITVLDHVDDNFWMKTAYRIPDTPNASVVPGSTGFATVPISKLYVRSFITNVGDGGVVNAGSATLRGIAFDGGSGIRRVEVSTDGGTDLESVGTRTGLRQIQLQAMESPVGRQARRVRRSGARDVQRRHHADVDADLESRRLHAQRHRDL